MLVLLFMVLCLQTGTTQTKECTPPFHPLGNQCLYFGALILQDHENARAVCQSLGGNLARITKPQQLKYIVDYMEENDYADASYWLDGTDIADEGQWTYSNGEAVPMGTPYWYVQYVYISGTWHLQPDNAHAGLENCLEMASYYHLYFNDAMCNTSNSILCEENVQIEEKKVEVNLEEVSCPPLFVPVSEGLCLAFLTFAEQTWAEARQTCDSLGGQLAKITQPQHLRDLYLYINHQGLSEDSFWIGGSDQENEGIWLYTDGSAVPSGTPFWGINTYPVQEPDGNTLENCLFLSGPGQYYFRDDPCNLHYNPLCSSQPLEKYD